jgi:hypothetical protein
MTITLRSQENIQSLLRRCGYFFVREENGELAFARPMSSSASGYPRFHIYAKLDNVSRETLLNLHLDQKKPSYGGTAAHSGEYNGEVVEREAARIRQILGL